MTLRIGKRKYSLLAGKSPGTLLKQSDENLRLRMIRYDESQFSIVDLNSSDDIALASGSSTVCWLQVMGIGDSSALLDLGEKIGIHKLTLEDIQNTDRRYAIEQHTEYSFQTIKRSRGSSDPTLTDVETISLLLKPGMVVSFHEDDAASLDKFVRRIESGVGRLRRSGAGYLFYALNDEALDTWMVHLEGTEDHLLALEDQVLLRFDESLIETIHSWKKHIAWLRWLFRPYRDMLNTMSALQGQFFGEQEQPYLRDLSSHGVRVLDLVELYREMADDLLMIHMTVLSNRMNRIMKVLTIISTIFIPITFIAGIYGMNFLNMPELSWRWGYPAALGAMAISVVGMLVYFRRKRWI